MNLSHQLYKTYSISSPPKKGGMGSSKKEYEGSRCDTVTPSPRAMALGSREKTFNIVENNVITCGLVVDYLLVIVSNTEY